MKHTNTFLIGALIISALLSGCAGVALAQSAAAEASENPVCAPCQQPPRTLNVNGSGRAYLTPDMAYVNIGVHTEGANAAEAVAENSVNSQAVKDALIKKGIDKKDIQTTNFSITPQPQYDQEGKPTGKIIYSIDNTVFVTVRNIDLVGAVLDAAVAAGANSIYGIQFDVSDKTVAISEARKAAVADARAKAEELARASGVALGAVQTISEYTNYPAPMYESKVMMAAPGAASVPISPGQMTLTIEVNIVYEIQ